MKPAVLSSPREIALWTKIARLPVDTRRPRRLSRFDFSRHAVLCWYRVVNRRDRRYSMRCEVLDDGALEVSFTPLRDLRKARRIPRARHF